MKNINYVIFDEWKIKMIVIMENMENLIQIFEFRKNKNLQEYLDISCGDRVYWKRFKVTHVQHGYCFKILNKKVEFYWKAMRLT